MRQDQAALLWLVFSADALKLRGTLEEMLDELQALRRRPSGTSCASGSTTASFRA